MVFSHLVPCLRILDVFKGGGSPDTDAKTKEAERFVIICSTTGSRGRWGEGI